MNRKLKKLYISYRRRGGGIFVSLPAFFGQRFSYITVMRRIYRVLPRSLQLRFYMILFLSFIRAVAETSTIFVISLMAQSVSSPDSIRARWFYRLIVPHLPEYFIFRLNGDRTLITAICMLVVGFIILKNGIIYATVSNTTFFSEKVGLFISREAYARFLAKEYLWHISKKSKEMINRIDQLGRLTSLTTLIIQVLGNLLCAFMMFAFLFMLAPGLTAIAVSVFTVVGVTTYSVLRKKVDRTGAEAGRLDARRNWAVRMVARGIREIIIYGKQREFLESVTETIRENIPKKTFLALSGSIPGWFLEVSGFCIIFSTMVYMVGGNVPMPVIVSSMSLLLLTAWRVLPTVSRSMGMAVRIRAIRSRALSCLALLEGFAAAPGETKEPPPAARPEALPFACSIELRGVAFRYPGAGADTVRSLSLTVAKGEHLGFVGKSGAGKSTVGMLLAGLFTPASGSMLVDGTEINAETLDAYRAHIGYVPQTPLLLPGTLADNIALSDWGGEYDREKLERACRFAAMDFVVSGEKTLDFVIGQGGEGLSGGETQRVSIARALYTGSDVLIFDEATSSLDQAGETAIARAVRDLRGKVTTVVIAHRLTTLKECDRIVWLENGAIREIGPPETILPRYAADPAKKTPGKARAEAPGAGAKPMPAAARPGTRSPKES